jgi:tetratricopeptide (TPR) repeat protein
MRHLSHQSLISNLLLTGAIAFLGVGCASTSGVKEDKAAAAKSQVYLEGASYVRASEIKGRCQLPADADKRLAGTGAAGQSKDWKTLIASANACVAEKNWATLEPLANTIARTDLNSPWGAYFLSVAAEARNDHPRALWMVDLAQKKAGGKSGLFSYQKGRVLLGMKETLKGMAEIEKALALQPDLLDGRLFLAEIHQRDQDPVRAAKHFAAALEVEATNYRALTGLAEVKLREGSGTEAAALYSRAVEAHPQQLRPWVRLAFIYESLQKNNELALNTLRGLKSGLDRGAVKERPDFDLGARLKALEAAVAPKPVQGPVQASVEKADE